MLPDSFLVFCSVYLFCLFAAEFIQIQKIPTGQGWAFKMEELIHHLCLVVFWADGWRHKAVLVSDSNSGMWWMLSGTWFVVWWTGLLQRATGWMWSPVFYVTFNSLFFNQKVLIKRHQHGGNRRTLTSSVSMVPFGKILPLNLPQSNKSPTFRETSPEHACHRPLSLMHTH